MLTTVALGMLLRGVRAGLVRAAAVSGRALGIANPRWLPGGARISLSRRCWWHDRDCLRRAAAFLRFGRWGVRMRAAGQSPLLAAQRGINLHAIYALAWSLSTFTGRRRHADRARFRLGQHHGHHRLEGVSGRSGRRADSLAGALFGSLIIAG